MSSKKSRTPHPMLGEPKEKKTGNYAFNSGYHDIVVNGQLEHVTNAVKADNKKTT